jgi:ribokinase
MARLGASVTMAGRVGSDTFGEQLLQALRNDKINTELVVVDQKETTGVAFIFLTSKGDNAIVVASGANASMGHDQAHYTRIVEAMQQAQALVLQLEIPVETVSKLIADAHKAGLLIILNLAPAQQLTRETLQQVSVLVLNENEASLLSGQRVENVEDARVVATVLHERGIGTVVITLGSQGALLLTKDEKGKVRSIFYPAPKVRVVDTTAAGDCFVGALTVALTEGQTAEKALRFAVLASTLKVTKFGAQSGLPTRDEVQALSAQQPLA